MKEWEYAVFRSVKYSMNVASSIFFFVHLFFLLAVHSRRTQPGPWLVHLKFLLAVGYLIIGPGLPLLQVITRYEISLTRVYLFLLGLHSAQRARISSGLVRYSCSFFSCQRMDRMNL